MYVFQFVLQYYGKNAYDVPFFPFYSHFYHRRDKISAIFCISSEISFKFAGS